MSIQLADQLRFNSMMLQLGKKPCFDLLNLLQKLIRLLILSLVFFCSEQFYS